MWKISIYLLFIALPAWGITSFVGENKSESKGNILEEMNINSDESPTDGAILGSVIAPNAEITVKAYNDDIEIVSEVDEQGDFFINGFEEGIYTISISTNKLIGMSPKIFKDVLIKKGEVTALGTVAFE